MFPDLTNSQHVGRDASLILGFVAVLLFAAIVREKYLEIQRRAFPLDFHYRSLLDRISFACTMTELAYLREEVTQFWLDCIVDGETKSLEMRHSILIEMIEAREVFINKARKRIS